MPFHFKATHSTGTVHLRRSTSRGNYAWAVVGTRVGDMTCHRSAELAQAERSRRSQWIIQLETVQLAEIDSKAYAAILKAGKGKAKTTFLGKTFTKTWDICGKPYCAAIGIERLAHETRHSMDSIHPQRRAHLAELAPQHLARHDAAVACGYWLNPHSHQVDVYWYRSREEAEEAAINCRNLAAFVSAEVLEVA